jgi:acyl-CoA thioesterase-1
MPDGRLLPTVPPRPERHEVVFLGDSLTDGFGLERRLAYPSLIQDFWNREGVGYTAVNEGVSGDTTRDVLGHLGSSRGPGAELTVLEIGANDAFQAVPVPEVEANIARIIRVLKAGGSRVALASMSFGPGFLPAGDEYTREFNALYARVGTAEHVAVLPPLLRSLFARPSLWQEDGIHPTAEGHALIARDLLGDLNPAWRD